MKLNERQIEISKLVQQHGKVEVKELSESFATSSVTIRKDLELLQSRGILQRTHGGAILAENISTTIPVGVKLGQHPEQKTAVANAALEVIEDCFTVALDAGSTTLALARLLHDKPISIVTNSLLIAEEMSSRESGTVIMTGGIWRKEASCYIGPAALKALDNINIDVALIGVSGFSPEIGFCCQNSMEAQIKEKMMQRAAKKYIITDSSKYGARSFCTFARSNDINGLIVDDGLPIEAREAFSAQGLHISIVKTK